MRPNIPNKFLRINASIVQAAIERARRLYPHEWQAELLEILCIPEVHAYWQEINDRFPKVEIVRYEAEFYPHEVSMQEFRDAEACDQISGYFFSYGLSNYCWNSVRSDYYAHNPSTTWDGVRRETYCSWVEALRDALSYGEDNQYVADRFRDYNVVFVNDLDNPVQESFL